MHILFLNEIGTTQKDDCEFVTPKPHIKTPGKTLGTPSYIFIQFKLNSPAFRAKKISWDIQDK